MDMSQEIFNPRTRREAIETTCSNLIMVGYLEPEAVAEFLSILFQCDDTNLALVLVQSRIDYGNYLEHGLPMN